jgi:hypothetical protein
LVTIHTVSSCVTLNSWYQEEYYHYLIFSSSKMLPLRTFSLTTLSMTLRIQHRAEHHHAACCFCLLFWIVMLNVVAPLIWIFSFNFSNIRLTFTATNQPFNKILYFAYFHYFFKSNVIKICKFTLRVFLSNLFNGFFSIFIFYYICELFMVLYFILKHHILRKKINSNSRFNLFK